MGAPVLQLLDTVRVHRLQVCLIEGETPSLSFHDEKEKMRFHLLNYDRDASHETARITFPDTGEEH